jgi:hypothetical protein
MRQVVLLSVREKLRALGVLGAAAYGVIAELQALPDLTGVQVVVAGRGFARVYWEGEPLPTGAATIDVAEVERDVRAKAAELCGEGGAR